MSPLFAFFDIPLPLLLMLAIAGVLLYGERLPQVAASWGKQLIQLKRKMQGIRDDFESALRDTTSSVNRIGEKTYEPGHEEATAPKFEPPPLESGESSSNGTAASETAVVSQSSPS